MSEESNVPSSETDADESLVLHIMSMVQMSLPTAQQLEDMGHMLHAWAHNNELEPRQVLVALSMFSYSALAQIAGDTKGIAEYMSALYVGIAAIAESNGMKEYVQLVAQGVPEADARAAIEMTRSAH